MFENVRAIFGGRCKRATSGAAPIATEILEFFYACGIVVLEGYGMTETATAATFSTDSDFRFGTVGRALPGRRSDRRRRRDPDQGREHLRGLPQPCPDVVRRHRGRMASHRRPRLARPGWLPLDHGPQEGHHHHRGRQEPDPGEHRERPEAVPLDLPGRDVRGPPALPGRRWSRSTRRRSRSSPASTGCPRTSIALTRPAGARPDPGRGRPRERQIRTGRAGQEVRDPRPRSDPGDGRANPDPEGQAQRREREVRAAIRRALHG